MNNKMKLLIVVITLGANSVYANHCYNQKIRESFGGSFCKSSISKRTGKTLYSPTDRFTEELQDQISEYSGWFDNEEEKFDTFMRVVSPKLSELPPVEKKYTKEQFQRLNQQQKTYEQIYKDNKDQVEMYNNRLSTDTAYQKKFLDSTPKDQQAKVKEHINVINNGSTLDLLKCDKDPSCRATLDGIDTIQQSDISQASKKQKATDEAITVLNRQLNNDTSKLLNKLKGPMLDQAVVDLGKLGLKVNKSDLAHECHSILTGEYFELNPSVKNQEKLINKCDEFHTKKEVYSNLYNQFKGLQSEIQDEDDINDILGLRLGDLQDQTLAKKRLLEQVKKKSEGTVLGSMIEQLRADMCNIASNKEIMCQGVPLSLSSLVDDSGKAIQKSTPDPSRKAAGNQSNTAVSE